MNDGVLINKEDLETIDNNMAYLSNNLDTVANNVSQMEGRINQVSKEFNILQDDLKKTVMDTQRTALVLNAKQTIMLLRQEYDRKYRYRDDIRRKVKGLIQTSDINRLKKSTLKMIGEESIINSPDYWLAPALLALCSWYLNDKESANNYLNESLKRDAETTSLLFCLIHIRAKRYQTATRWLNRYLSMQNPTSIDGKISLVFEAITSGVFNNEMQELCVSHFEGWMKILNENANYKETQLEKWQNKFKTYYQKKTKESNPYINNFVLEKELINNRSCQIDSVEVIYNEFKNIFKKTSSKSETTTKVIDKLIDILINNCDSEELQLNNSLAMNEYIVKCDGNIDEAIKKYDSNNNLNQYRDFYTHITSVALNYDNPEYSSNTIKMALAFSKDIILSAYRTVANLFEQNDNILTIKIEEFSGTTENGSNERELVSNLINFLEQRHHQEIYSPKLIDFKNIISFILAVILIIFGHKYVIILLLGLLCITGYNIATIYKKYQERKKKLAQLNSIKKYYVIVLLNIIAEIVDVHFKIQDKIKENEEFINFLTNLNYHDYFVKTIDNNYRNIIKEEN